MVVLRYYVETAVGLWLGGHLDQLDALISAEGRAGRDVAAEMYNAAVAARDKVADGLADLEVSKALGDIQPAVFRRAKDKLTAQLADAERVAKEAAAALETPEADTDLLRGAIDRGWTPDDCAALHAVLSRVEVAKDAMTIVPVTGEPAIRARAELTPRCGVSGCGRVRYTANLCKSHTMRARNIGGGDLFEALVSRVAEDGPGLTVEEVEAVFEKATAANADR